jgi:hypothetical protein
MDLATQVTTYHSSPRPSDDSAKALPFRAVSTDKLLLILGVRTQTISRISPCSIRFNSFSPEDFDEPSNCTTNRHSPSFKLSLNKRPFRRSAYLWWKYCWIPGAFKIFPSKTKVNIDLDSEPETFKASSRSDAPHWIKEMKKEMKIFVEKLGLYQIFLLEENQSDLNKSFVPKRMKLENRKALRQSCGKGLLSNVRNRLR